MQKMRVGRHNGVKWTGAIGAYLEDKTLEAENKNAGRMEGRIYAPGKNLTDNRIRTLRVVSDYAWENGMTFAHQLTVADFMKIRLHIVEQARPRCGNAQLSDSTLQSFNESLRAWSKYCIERHWMPKEMGYLMKKHFPTGQRHHRQFLVIPEEDIWEGMIADAWKTHPVDGMVLATGYYELLRWSEQARARIGNLDLGDQMGHFSRDKRSDVLNMPLADNYCAWLDRYLHWYRTLMGGELRDDWHLIPGRVRGKGNTAVNPLTYLDDTAANKVVKGAVMKLGYTREELAFQATHLSRRSGGEALYQGGVDIRDIAYYYGHFVNGAPNIDMTLRYLGHAFNKEKLAAGINKRGKKVGNELAPIEPVAPVGMPVTGVGVSAAQTITDIAYLMREGALSPQEARDMMQALSGVSGQASGGVMLG